jgi:hypothetical protein
MMGYHWQIFSGLGDFWSNSRDGDSKQGVDLRGEFEKFLSNREAYERLEIIRDQ